MNALKPPPKPVSPRVCVLINQLAFPGLGTRLAGRRWGWAQMIIMVAGFCLSMGFMIWFMISVARLLATPGASESVFWSECRRMGWIGGSGLTFVILAWLWAGASSLNIWREDARQPPPIPGPARR